MQHVGSIQDTGCQTSLQQSHARTADHRSGFIVSKLDSAVLPFIRSTADRKIDCPAKVLATRGHTIAGGGV